MKPWRTEPRALITEIPCANYVLRLDRFAKRAGASHDELTAELLQAVIAAHDGYPMPAGLLPIFGAVPGLDAHPPGLILMGSDGAGAVVLVGTLTNPQAPGPVTSWRALFGGELATHREITDHKEHLARVGARHARDGIAAVRRAFERVSAGRAIVGGVV